MRPKEKLNHCRNPSTTIQLFDVCQTVWNMFHSSLPSSHKAKECQLALDGVYTDTGMHPLPMCGDQVNTLKVDNIPTMDKLFTSSLSMYFSYISTFEEGTTSEQWTKHSSLTHPLFGVSINWSYNDLSFLLSTSPLSPLPSPHQQRWLHS